MLPLCGEDGWEEKASPQSLQVVETLLRADVDGPHEVFCDVNTKDLSALNDLHRGGFEAQWRVSATSQPYMSTATSSDLELRENCLVSAP